MKNEKTEAGKLYVAKIENHKSIRREDYKQERTFTSKRMYYYLARLRTFAIRTSTLNEQ